MRLLNEVEIQGFRSICSVEIKPLADFTAFAGLNNSGKSNVLRALNAFFNDETDLGQPVNVDADYFRPDLRKKKRKRIRVSVTFKLPGNFTFRRGLEGVKTLLGGDSFKITKEWSRNNPQPTFLLNDNKLNLDDREKVAQFLQLIKYRYIPNRVLPTQLIRNEHESLRGVLVRRLAKSAKGDVKAFAAIRDTSARMIESLNMRFQEACPEQGTVSLATPTSWNDLAFAFGYRLARDGIEIKDTEQGSGIQSLLMLETLYLIDQDYFQQFGWRQAAIWGFEEPESSMHSYLEARVAAYLADIAGHPQGRLQVLCTTHSDLVVQYAGCTVVVDQRNGESKFEPIQDPRTALDRLSSAGVARLGHPILFWPLDPIILVEGQFDREFLEKAFCFFKPKRQVRVVDLPSLDPSSGSGGVDRMQQYIKNSAKAIQLRRPEAPVVVVLDWDAAGKQEQFKKLVTGASAYKVLVWPVGFANPRAGKSFKGIERFHCDRVLDLAIKRRAPIGRKTKGGQPEEYIVEAADYGQVKQTLAAIVREGLQQSDFVHAEAFIKQILQEAGAS
jgi:energy-coupling factor transporter ATP-binding protein EcfA2